MKFIKILGIGIVSTLLVSSCQKFLDTDTPSNFTQEVVYGNVSDATKGVYSIYALFNQDAFTSRLSNSFIQNTDVEIGVPNATPSGDRRDIWAIEATETNTDIRTVWGNAYSAINRANIAIEGIEQSKIAKDPDMQQLLGEAKALRALWYYWLINYWGDVPFSTKATKGGDNFYQPRVGRDTILSTLIDDLRSIEPFMKPAAQITYGVERINREFVIGLIARLSLCRGGYWLYPDMVSRRKSDYLDYYTIARDYSKKLIDNYDRPLNPDYEDVFKKISSWVVLNNSDVLYEVAFAPGFGDVGWNIGLGVDGGGHNYGSGSSYMTFNPAFVYSYDTLDTRLKTVSFLKYNSELQQTNIALTSVHTGKWNRLLMATPSGSASAKGTGINWPLMRYSDVLLMYAEAENELNGPTEEAKNALKRVRNRAFKEADRPEKVEVYVNNISASKETFFEAIVDERAWEFAGECTRRYDLIRWNNYGKKIVETKSVLSQMGENTFNGAGPYAYLPDVVYYKLNSDKTMSFYGSIFRKNATVPPIKDSPAKGDNPNGYTSLNWFKTLYTAPNQTTGAPGQPANYILWSWRGYSDPSGNSPVRYILPLHSSTVISSLGTLDNKGYGYGN
jgi:hypothetical protein